MMCNSVVRLLISSLYTQVIIRDWQCYHVWDILSNVLPPPCLGHQLLSKIVNINVHFKMQILVCTRSSRGFFLVFSLVYIVCLVNAMPHQPQCSQSRALCHTVCAISIAIVFFMINVQSIWEKKNQFSLALSQEKSR